MNDEKLAIDEARRAGQHGAVKAQVENEVQAEIAEHTLKTPPPAAGQIDQVADNFRAKAVSEVVQTEREVERGRGAARVSQIVDYIFYLIYALLGMRFLLALLAARSTAGFVRFIRLPTARSGWARLSAPPVLSFTPMRLRPSALTGARKDFVIFPFGHSPSGQGLE